MSESSRVVLITGAASGIGYAFAEHLARGGWRVVISDLRGAEAAALRLQAAGAEAIGVTADVVDESQMSAAVAAAVSRFGGLDALVNNAAIFTTLKLKPFLEISQAEWAQVMAVNAMGPFVCAKVAVPAMRQRGGGRIVNIASTVAVKGTVNMLHYVASKGALVSMTRSMARELGADSITVNAVAPGFTLSDGVLVSDLPGLLAENSARSRALKRDQVPADLVGAVAFLLGEGAAFMTGQTLAVDGGSAFL